ncbi:zinc-dependent alcohol dehydrogenase [Cutibacterium sp. V947]|uniref:zinc-dependent alcohol dehydrogenase n=1 Tax=unclassified Cutibacterium TaxID=2649671 RepID=UPI003EDFB902
MRAWIYNGPGDVSLDDVPSPAPGRGEIRIDVKAATTCGTDLKTYRRGHHLMPPAPSRFGHEVSGIVESIGEGVTKFKPGDRVVAANTVPCGHCWACQKGRESLCENLEFLWGAFAEQLVISAGITARNTYLLPDDIDFSAAAPLEPLACVVHGIAEAGIQLGDTVVVHGAGPIGLMFVRLATASGAHVISVDTSVSRLEQASHAGAVDIVALAPGRMPREYGDIIRKRTPAGRGADIGIEATGYAPVWEQNMACLRPGATAIMFGGTKAGSSLPLDTTAMHYNEYLVKGVFHHTPKYVATALDMLTSGIIDGHDLVTEERPLNALVESLEDMAAGHGAKYALIP